MKRRDLPKEPRYISHNYHIIDYHSNDHYGICGYTRMCYQQTFVPPTELTFAVEGNVLYSSLLIDSDESMSLITTAMNIVLKMVGHFEICTSEKVPALPPMKQFEVPWEILRAGSSDKAAWEQHMRQIIENNSAAKQVEITHRHETLWRENPEFCALGSQNFWGYIAYGFPKHNFYVFESNSEGQEQPFRYLRVPAGESGVQLLPYGKQPIDPDSGSGSVSDRQAGP